MAENGITLTLDSEASASAAAAMEATAAAPSLTQVKEAEPVVLDESSLTEEERKMVEDFSEKIDIKNSSIVLQYGAGAQKKIADFSDGALSSVRTKDLGEVGNMITDLITELEGFEIDENDKGIFGFFKRSANKLSVLKTKYEKAEVNIDKITNTLEDHQIQLLKDVAMLDKMYELNLNYFKELTMYIIAGKKCLEKFRNTELAEAVAKAKETNTAEDAQYANDLAALADRFEKKLHDLELTRMVSIQMGPQIRLLQNSDTLMVEKIHSTIVNTIPLWKSQMTIALGIAHSQQAMQAQREVTNMTNELLKKNADMLKMGTVEVAKESERGVVDIETLKHTNQTLISTLDEVIKIQNEGREKRKAAEVELGRIEGELRAKLLEIDQEKKTVK